MTVKGVTARIRLFFFTFPHSSAKTCCEMLGLDHKKYGKMCRNIKSDTKKLLDSGVQGRLLSPLKHREEMKLDLLKEVVDSVIFEASKRRPREGDPKPFDEWYVVPNRNRMMFIRNEYVNIKIFPKTGTCRVLPTKPMPYEWILIACQHAFWKAGVDLDISEKVSETLKPSRKHRIFKVGPVTPFKIKHYKKSLGLTILADGTHPDFIETEEDFPSWIKPLLSVIKGNTEAIKGLRNDFPKDLNRIATRFEKAMDEHLNIIRIFREESIKRSEEIVTRAEEERKRTDEIKARQDRRDEILGSFIEVIQKTLLKPKRKRSKRKPKPKTRWQKLRKRLRF